MTLKDLKKIQIVRLEDYQDCETCGGGGAEGAEVRFDFDPALNFTLEPVAGCCNIITYDDWDIFKNILAKLGYELVEEGR